MRRLGRKIELHLFSPVESVYHIELLTAVAHYYAEGVALDLGHTVNFGRPWIPKSECEYGLITRPYGYGAKLEADDANGDLAYLWLVPISEREREYKKTHGYEALESLFESRKVNVIDAERRSAVR